MEGQNNDNAMQVVPHAYNWTLNSFSGLVWEGDINQQCLLASPESYGLHHAPVPVSQWIQFKQTPQYYVDLPSENVCPLSQKEMPYHVLSEVPSLALRYTPPLEEYMSTEEKKSIKIMSTENPLNVQKQVCGDDYARPIQLYNEPNAAASKSNNPSASHPKSSKEKAQVADRCRRLRISHWLDALKDLLPRPEKRSKEALLGEAIEHVQHLQHQLKDLSRSRLGGETASSSFIHIEGLGHYAVRDQMLYGPLEEKIGKLIEINPSAFNELLQSRGLVVMPMAYAELLPKP